MFSHLAASSVIQYVIVVNHRSNRIRDHLFYPAIGRYLLFIVLNWLMIRVRVCMGTYQTRKSVSFYNDLVSLVLQYILIYVDWRRIIGNRGKYQQRDNSIDSRTLMEVMEQDV